MSDWRKQVVDQFAPGAHRIHVASDPDGFLVESEINRQIRERGFDVLPYDDPIAFRHTYETKYRRHWPNRDARPGLVVRVDHTDVSALPYDVIDSGEVVRLRLADVFPGLHVPVIRQLDPADWDALQRAIGEHDPDGLNADETKTFVLRHVFQIDPALIDDESTLLHFLLRRHYNERQIPQTLDEHLVGRLAERDAFTEWPLRRIVPSASDFFGFLQERWPLFLHRAGVESGVAEPPSAEALTYDGPTDLPFDDPDVKSYVDSLFLDRMLAPVTLPGVSPDEDRWLRVGIRIDEDADRRFRFDRLSSELREELPDAGAQYSTWIRTARQWAELTVLRHQIGDDVTEPYREIQGELDEQFEVWMHERYGGLYNQPPPVMTHHVPQYLERQLDEGAERVALVVVDGLALDQWVVVRDYIRANRTDWTFDESALFAWVPTLTDVSRQSIFAGKMPLEFPDQLGGTGGEEKLWRQFWSADLSKTEVDYVKVEGQRGDLSDIQAAIRAPRTTALGIVLFQVDDIMHGMTMGTAGMHTSVAEWAERGALLSTLDALREEGYRTYLTADHGNIEAAGTGTLREGDIVERRGRRARIYKSEGLRDSAADGYSESVSWPSTGLPEGYYALLSAGRTMFDREDEHGVVHGGMALEEVIVPFIEVT
jgi:hypothetical protein